jgi:hypothetical protein
VLSPNPCLRDLVRRVRSNDRFRQPSQIGTRTSRSLPERKASIRVLSIVASLAGLLFGFADLGYGQCDTPHFNSPPAFNAGTNPNSVATGDLNGDGIPDLVIPNLTTDTFSILFADGEGAFLPPLSYNVGIKGTTVGAYPRAAAIGDLNADGKRDLIIGGGYNHSWVSVLLGDGTGNFGPALNQAVGNNGELTGVVLGDFNGDGKQDVAAAGSSSLAINFLLGNGAGGFGSTSQVTVTSQPQAIAASDFNLDGLPDVVAINTYPTWAMTIVWGRSDGNFVVNQSITTRSQPKAVAVADLNKDGKVDIAMAFGWADYGVELRFGDGAQERLGRPLRSSRFTNPSRLPRRM